MPQPAVMTAPAGISPWLTYLARAMSSLRASATIEMRRIRPRSEPTRWRNQQLRALAGWYLTHIQASSIMVVRRRGLPAFEIPCWWLTLPLFHGHRQLGEARACGDRSARVVGRDEDIGSRPLRLVSVPAEIIGHAVWL